MKKDWTESIIGTDKQTLTHLLEVHFPSLLETGRGSARPMFFQDGKAAVERQSSGRTNSGRQSRLPHHPASGGPYVPSARINHQDRLVYTPSCPVSSHRHSRAVECFSYRNWQMRIRIPGGLSSHQPHFFSCEDSRKTRG